MKARKKVATFIDLSGAIHCVIVPARTSDRRLAALVAVAKEHADRVVHCWEALRYWSAVWRAVRPIPASFRPDDGPEQPVPVIRRVLWAVEQDPNAASWMQMLEGLLLADPLG